MSVSWPVESLEVRLLEVVRSRLSDPQSSFTSSNRTVAIRESEKGLLLTLLRPVSGEWGKGGGRKEEGRGMMVLLSTGCAGGKAASITYTRLVLATPLNEIAEPQQSRLACPPLHHYVP
jgi:hypothetical protein